MLLVIFDAKAELLLTTINRTTDGEHILLCSVAELFVKLSRQVYLPPRITLRKKYFPSKIKTQCS